MPGQLRDGVPDERNLMALKLTRAFAAFHGAACKWEYDLHAVQVHFLDRDDASSSKCFAV